MRQGIEQCPTEGSGVPQTWDPAEEHNVAGGELLTVAATTDSGTGATILTVAGEADMLTAPVLRQRLDDHFGTDRTPIIVDLSRVEFLGSNALAVLFDVHERASAEGRTFAVVAATRVIRRPLQVTGLDTTLSVHEDLDQALKAVHASAAQRPHRDP
ncbi:MAG: STAS domain-containing protein [Pseudonocardiaceae bacterium]